MERVQNPNGSRVDRGVDRGYTKIWSQTEERLEEPLAEDRNSRYVVKLQNDGTYREEENGRCYTKVEQNVGFESTVRRGLVSR